LDAVLPAGIHLVVERDGASIGHALLVPAGSKGVAEYAVFLHQEHRGRGAGTEVNRVAVDVAREAGLKRLWLSVEPANRAAIGSYTKAGFHFLPGTTLSREAEMEIEL
jgi:RimJ/RimL family protein N-acetyltransferase